MLPPGGVRTGAGADSWKAALGANDSSTRQRIPAISPADSVRRVARRRPSGPRQLASLIARARRAISGCWASGRLTVGSRGAAERRLLADQRRRAGRVRNLLARAARGDL